MRHNLYDEREKEARRLNKLISDSPWRKKEVFSKPVWDGNYQIRWVLNPKHETHPQAEVAKSLVHLIPKQVVSKYSYQRWKKDGQKSVKELCLVMPGSFHISEDQFYELNSRQQKFFTNTPYYQWFDFRPIKNHTYVDYRGRTVYRMKSWEFNFFYVPVITKNRVNYTWVRAEEPEYRKWTEKLFNSGFGQKYLFKEHHSHRYREINPKQYRQQSRELQYQIQQGLKDYYEEG